MLASITPLGERGRHNRYAITLAAFLLGATAAGAAIGLLLGAAGAALLGTSGSRLRLAVLAAALAVALVIDLRPGAAPGPRRQVDERWLDHYRGWVYGLGFGVQLGSGPSTIVTSAATYVALLAALLSGGAMAGAVVYGSYGLLRGATPLLAARVRRPDQLLRLHETLGRLRPGTTLAAQIVLGALLVAAAGGAIA